MLWESLSDTTRFTFLLQCDILIGLESKGSYNFIYDENYFIFSHLVSIPHFYFINLTTAVV